MLNGHPLEGAEVVFAPVGDSEGPSDEPASTGITDDVGEYELSVYNSDEIGAVVGEHRVAISMPDLDAAVQKAMYAEGKKALADGRSLSKRDLVDLEKELRESLGNQPKIPEKYNNQTILTFEVEAGENKADFDLMTK